MKQAFEDLVSLIKELPGGTNASGATVLASDTFGVAANVCAYAVDTEGAAATDDLRWIGGTPRNGQIIFVGGYNAGRINTMRHAAGGAGQIYTLDGSDFVLRDINMFVPLRYSEGATAWYMLDFPETFRINQMPGGKVAATLTMAANAATPTQALHALDTSGGAAEDLRILTQNTANRDIQLLTLYGANAGRVPTLKHAYGGNGQIYMSDSADFALSGNRTITLRRNGNQWNELFRTGVVAAAGDVYGPASVTDGRVAVFDGGTGKLLKQDTRLAANLVAGPATATDKSVALFDGATGKLLKDGIAPGTSGNVLTSDGTNWTSAAPAGSSSFTSSDQTITIAGSLTIAHGLAAAPKLVLAVLVNVTAEANYTTGDVVTIVLNPPAIRFDATNLNIRYSSSSIQVSDKTSGLNSSITPANWKMRFHAR